jgi:hypothetical protein
MASTRSTEGNLFPILTGVPSSLWGVPLKDTCVPGSTVAPVIFWLSCFAQPNMMIKAIQSIVVIL